MRFEDIKNHNIFSFFISLFSSFHFSACDPSQDWLLWLTSWYSRHDPQAPSSIPFPFYSKPFPSTQRLFLVIKMLNHLGPQGGLHWAMPLISCKGSTSYCLWARGQKAKLMSGNQHALCRTQSVQSCLYLWLCLRTSILWTHALWGTWCPIMYLLQMLNHPGKYPGAVFSTADLELLRFSDLSAGICHCVCSTAWGWLDGESAPRLPFKEETVDAYQELTRYILKSFLFCWVWLQFCGWEQPSG